MSDLSINYSGQILVRQRHNSGVIVKLSSQGPQGPAGHKGDTGDVTPAAQALLTEARDIRDDMIDLAASAEQQALLAEGHAGNAYNYISIIQGHVNAANSSAQAAELAKDGAVSARNTASGYAQTASDAVLLADNARTAAVSAKNDAEAARTQVANDLISIDTMRTLAQNAATAAESHRDNAILARNAAQNAATAADQSKLDAKTHRDAAEDFAEAAALSALAAATFDPSSYPMKSNNGSDYTDPAAFRANIGAATAYADVTEAEARAGTVTAMRNWSPERVAQAIDALAAAKTHLHTISDVTGLQDALNSVLVDAALTGDVTAPTPTTGDASTKVATTRFVKDAIDDLIGAAPGTLDTLQEFADAIGNDANFAATVLGQIAAKASIASPEFTGAPKAPTPAAGTNNATIATTAFVKDAITTAAAGFAAGDHDHTIADIIGLQDALDEKVDTSDLLPISSQISDIELELQGAVSDLGALEGDVSALESAVANKASIASPAFTGVPTAPTADVGTTTTQVATTSFVATAVNNAVAGLAGEAHTHTMADVAGLSAAIAGLAPLASPALSGTPTAPTPTTGDDSGKIATTAFVAATAEKYLPLDGGVLTGAVTFPLPTTNGASLNIPHGTEPTTLVDGDVWSTVAGLSMYINGTARTFFDDQNLLAATQIEAEAGSATAVRIWSSERIRQAILAAPIGAATQSALDGKVGVSGAQTVAGVKTFSDTAVFSTGATFSGKLSFGSTLVTAVNDLSKHIALWGSTYGLTVTENNLNFVSASAFQWAVGTSVKMTLTSAGDLTAVGNVTAYSDARLKSKVKTIENALDVVDQLRGVYFEMNNRRGMGLIAQELEAVIPELVFKGADEQQTRSVAYANLVALLIEAIKELRAEVNELKKGSV